MGIRASLALFALAVALRLLNLWHLSAVGTDFIVEDAVLYNGLADDWQATGHFVRAVTNGYQIETERVPLYVMFMVGVRGLLGNAPEAIGAMQALVDGITCLLIARLGSMITPRVGWIAGLLATFWPNFIIHSAMLLQDTLFVMLSAAFMLAAALFLRAGGMRPLLAAGFFTGLSLITRPILQFLLPFMALAGGAILYWYRRHVLLVVAGSIGFLVLALAPATPLLLRNISQFGSVALTSQGGTHLLYWVVPLVEQAQSGTPRADTAARLQDELAKRTPADPANPYAVSNAMSTLALEKLRQYPLPVLAKAWAQGMAINLGAPALSIDPRVRALPRTSFMDIPGDSLPGRILAFLKAGDPMFRMALIIGLAGAGIAALLQAWGFLLLLRDFPWATLLAGIFILYVLLLSGPVASPKYRLPYEPVLILCMALALEDLWRRLRPL